LAAGDVGVVVEADVALVVAVIKVDHAAMMLVVVEGDGADVVDVVDKADEGCAVVKLD
jgi:hypothetical protein